MNTNVLLNHRTVSTLTLGGLMSVNAAPAPKPNIIHILVDDLGWQDVVCNYKDYHTDTPFYETPNIDNVADRGIRFTQAYSPAVTCAPSRAAYMTGQYTPHNGVYHVNMGGNIPRARRPDIQQLDPYYVGRIMPGKPAIPVALKTAGYTTAHVGKWHISGSAGVPTPIQLGFDFSFDEHHNYNDPDIYDPKDPKMANFSGLFTQPKDRLKDAFNDPRFPLLEDDRPYDSMVDISTRWISKVGKKDQPFFLNFCPSLVHGPIMTRDKKRLQYFCDKLGIPFPTDQGSIADPKVAGQHNPYYASMINSVDWMVGQLVQILEKTDDPRNLGHKLIDNTYVIISSDNGGAQDLRNWKSADGKVHPEKVTDNAPLREGKARAYEGGQRIPFIVMGPGIKAGSVNRETPINLIDLFPTFMAMAGLEQDAALDIDGCNILPVMKGQQNVARFLDGKDRDTLYMHYPVLNGSFSTIRRGNWKLMKNTGNYVNTAPEIQLFNLSDDLSETKNLANQHPEMTQQLLADLNQWLDKYDAGVPYNNPDYNGKNGAVPGQENMPAILQRGSEKDQLWATFETGNGKAEIADAFLLYTVNPGSGEEWFRAPVTLASGRVEATAPPGMTHGVFCLIDENNFLIRSEPVPLISKYGLNKPISPILEDGYAYKPGLFSLIKLCESSVPGIKKAGGETATLERAIAVAQSVYQKPVEQGVFLSTIRNLRAELLAFKGVAPEADTQSLNFFPAGDYTVSGFEEE